MPATRLAASRHCAAILALAGATIFAASPIKAQDQIDTKKLGEEAVLRVQEYFFRDLGIASYGFDPLLIPAAEESGLHGNNERISIENVKRGMQVMLEIVREVAAK